jgi:hypothetical protein
VGEVLEMSNEDLLKIRNFGEKSLVELQEKLAEHGITSPDDLEQETVGLGGITSDDLAELMGGGGEGDSTGVPEGMTFEDDSAALLTDESDGEDDQEYEEID